MALIIGGLSNITTGCVLTLMVALLVCGQPATGEPTEKPPVEKSAASDGKGATASPKFSTSPNSMEEIGEEEEEEDTVSSVDPPAAASAPLVIDYSIPQFYDEGLFYALFPARPERKTTTLAQILSRLIVYKHITNDHFYEVSFVDLEDRWPAERLLMTDNPTRLFDLFEINRTKEVNGTLKDTDIEYLGFKGREYEIRFSSPKNPALELVEKKVMFIVAHRLYFVGCVGPSAWVDSADATKLMDSISLGRAKPASSPAAFRWTSSMRTRDVQAIAKVAREKAVAAHRISVAASFNATVPHLPYVAEFPAKVRLIQADSTSFIFETTKTVHEVFVFYTTKLRANGWTFENAPPGTIKGFADLQSGSAGVGITIKVTATADATRVSMAWVRGTIVKTYVYRRR